MKPFIILLTLTLVSACVNTDSRFERIEGGRFVVLPMKLDSVYGLRNGDSVNASLRFLDGQDYVELMIALDLRTPPPRFTRGTYRSMIGGTAGFGTVECESPSFLGGQATVPSVGGVFLLKDSQAGTSYRVAVAPTPMKRPVAPVPIRPGS